MGAWVPEPRGKADLHFTPPTHLQQRFEPDTHLHTTPPNSPHYVLTTTTTTTLFNYTSPYTDLPPGDLSTVPRSLLRETDDADTESDGSQRPSLLHRAEPCHPHLTADTTDAWSLRAYAAEEGTMDILLANARAAEDHVHELLKSHDSPLVDIAAALDEYRLRCRSAILVDFYNAEPQERWLWEAHTEVRKYFHKSLKNFRKSHPDRNVETRQIIKHFLEFLKQSQRFYRDYIFVLNTACGGFAELKAIAHLSNEDGADQDLLFHLPLDLHAQALDSCHRSLIYLGDLSRYRTSEKLDKNPDYAHAIGYYELAANLKPSSGLGHHQQAVVALEERNHLRAIYHLYRAISVGEPHPLAENNLELEFGKTNAAWDKGELIQKGPPNDPDAAKRTLIGWFVRLHSMCSKGEEFRGHDELEREVLSQMANVIKSQRPVERPLMRMVLINMAAQDTAVRRVQGDPADQRHVECFFFYFRWNMRTFTLLLQIFYDDLRALLLNMEDHDVDLITKITPTARRLLPCLRVYNNWLLATAHLIEGLVDDHHVNASISPFWPAYAKTIDLIAQAFPIWDLEDAPAVSYMLEEDVDTIMFKPIVDETTLKTWYDKLTADLKPRFSGQDVGRLSPDDEMIHRVKDFLADGLNFTREENAPIKLQGTRVFFGDESNIDALTVGQPQYAEPIAPPKVRAQEPPKAKSYAAAAANEYARPSHPPAAPQKPVSKVHSRDDQLSRMVDELVDEDDGNNPITPPQQLVSNPTVLTDDEVPFSLHDSVPDITQPASLSKPISPIGSRPGMAASPPNGRSGGNTSRPMSGHHDRLQAVSRIWGDSPRGFHSSGAFPSGLPAGTMGSPAMAAAQGHSRVNSASSIRSRNSLNVIDSWGSTDSAPRTMHDTIVPNTAYGSISGLGRTGMARPLLFGAGGGPWSTGFHHASPPNGQGG